MYQASYAEALENAPSECRERERMAFDHAIDLLKRAESDGRGSTTALEAIDFVCRLWKALLEDLASADNDLPESLRGDLISVGIWVLRESDRLRAGGPDGFRSLIEVCATIRDGLR
ncbi:flagellar biosynthesis regulator FlaF [Methylocella sp.]|uniref:flagellar biosynthesis regulator FlaF n=1 Tax=Methylocella sp. TaxID=1978226 RepID=UPI003784263C